MTPRSSSSPRRSRPLAARTAACRLSLRPAPWHVEPKLRSSDRGPEVGVARRQLGVPGGERARGALAVDEEGGALAVDLVLLLLRDVVRDVVDELEAQPRPRPLEDGLERVPDLHGEQLPVGEPEEIGRASCRERGERRGEVEKL